MDNTSLTFSNITTSNKYIKKKNIEYLEHVRISITCTSLLYLLVCTKCPKMYRKSVLHLLK